MGPTRRQLARTENQPNVTLIVCRFIMVINSMMGYRTRN